MDGSLTKYYQSWVEDESDDPTDLTADMCYDGYTDEDHNRRRHRRLRDSSRFKKQRSSSSSSSSSSPSSSSSSSSSSLMLPTSSASYNNEEPTSRMLSDDIPLWQQRLYGFYTSELSWMVTDNSKEGLSMLFEGDDLFTATSLKGMCSIENTARNTFADFENYCWRSDEYVWNGFADSWSCAASRSLSNYVVIWNNLTSCDDITDSEVMYAKNLLATCRPYYDDKSLVGNCWNYHENSYTTKYNTGSKYAACNLPAGMEECARLDLVYDLFHALAPATWDDMTQSLQYAQSIIPR